MFINKTPEGLNNLCGKKISEYRLKMNISQRVLAERLQLIGLDLDKMPYKELSVEKDLLRILRFVLFSKFFPFLLRN